MVEAMAAKANIVDIQPEVRKLFIASNIMCCYKKEPDEGFTNAVVGVLNAVWRRRNVVRAKYYSSKFISSKPWASNSSSLNSLSP